MTDTTMPARSLSAPRRRRAEDVAGLGRARATLFAAPGLILIALFLLFPALWTVYLGLTNYRLTGLAAAEPKFIGLDNYVAALSDPQFWNSLWLTLVFVLISGIIGQTLLGFALAWMLRNLRGWLKTFVETLVLAAWVIPASVVSFLWLALLDRRSGTLNAILGTEGAAWLIEHPMEAIIIFNIWVGTAFSMQLFSSALSAVPPSQLESARMVGATTWQQMRDVILPNIKGHVLTNTLLITLWTFNTFTPYLLTAGGPNGATEILSVYIYHRRDPHRGSVRSGRARQRRPEGHLGRSSRVPPLVVGGRRGWSGGGSRRDRDARCDHARPCDGRRSQIPGARSGGARAGSGRPRLDRAAAQPHVALRRGVDGTAGLMGVARTRLHLTHDIQNENRYVRVPFEIPAGTDSFEVRITYDRDASVVDLGCEGADAWRGWSGGARTSFVICTDDATPGYLPGPLEPGEWAVVLGVHRLPSGGAPVDVEIRMPAESAMDHGPLAAPVSGIRKGSERQLPAPSGLRWFAGDFHGHTVHSDGQESISGLAALGAAAGLDFLAVTDHNTTSHHAHLPATGRAHGITLLPGQEVTTHRGHANAFGDIGWIDFRRPAQEWVDDVERRGGVLSVNHPISGDCSWLHPLERTPRAIELWHSTWYRELIATSPLAFFERWNPDTVLLGGADFHMRSEGVGPGTPTTWVAAEDASPEAILAGVAAGRTAIMGGVSIRDGLSVPDVFTAPVLLRLDGDLLAIDADGLILVDGRGERRRVDGARASFAADPAAGPHYLLHQDRQIAALCA